MPILTLLTDFGVDDYYVAAVKGILLARVPTATLVDISHRVPPGDIETAAFLLAAAAPVFPAGTVHLAVVDPGVGTERHLLVAETAGGFFVAPDNGLLTPFFAQGNVGRVWRQDLFCKAPGHTFHGRDRFAPIAAELAAGASFEDLCQPLADPIRLPLPAPHRDGTSLQGRVAHIDRYGNLITDLPAAWLPAGSFVLEVEDASGGRRHTTTRVRTYRELAPSEAGVLTGSLGTLEISFDGDSAAQRWNVRRGATVRVRHTSSTSPERIAID